MADHLGHLWQRTVRREPGAVAVVEAAARKTWTRAELAALAWQGSSGSLAGRDVAGRRFVLAGPNGAEWLAVFIALIDAGAVPVALDPTEPVEAQRAIARAAGAVGIWRGGEVEWCDAPGRRRSRNVCLLKLTSGSTGAPRALPFTHAQMRADGRQVCATMGIRPRDRNLAVIPFGHSYGLGNIVVPLLAQGTAVICASGPLPHLLAGDCAAWRATVFPAVPALLRALVLADIEPAALQSLRLVISAGAPLDATIAQAFAKKYARRVHGFYGTSETGGICFDRSGAATEAGRSVGRPLRGVRLEFRRGGRFVVTSAAVMASGSHSPADRGALNTAGELVLRGRAGRMLKVAGRRLDPGEIEMVLRTVPGVRGACVLAHPRKIDALAALVAGDVTAPALRTALVQRIARWKVPDLLMIREELPLTARGKTDLRRVRELLGAE